MTTALPTYTIEFDFTSSAQQAVLSALQQDGYSLLVFQSIPSLEDAQQTPIWLLQSFNDVFGVFTLTFTPEYKAYVTQGSVLGAENAHKATERVGSSFAMSNVVPLGTALVFNQNGSFTPDTRSAPANAIALRNAATAGSQSLTTGLAANIEGIYSPFSAAPIPPSTVVVTTPISNVVLGVSQYNIEQGHMKFSSYVQGAQLDIRAGQPLYTLSIDPTTKAVIGAGTTTVEAVSSNVMSKLASGG